MSYLRHFDSHDLLIAAFRYYLGRKTIQSACFAGELIKAWEEIPALTKSIIKRDLNRMFENTEATQDMDFLAREAVRRACSGD